MLKVYSKALYAAMLTAKSQLQSSVASEDSLVLAEAEHDNRLTVRI